MSLGLFCLCHPTSIYAGICEKHIYTGSPSCDTDARWISKAFISATCSLIKTKKPKWEAQTFGVVLQGEADPLGRPGEAAVNHVHLHRRLGLLLLPLVVLFHVLIWCETEAMRNRVNDQAGAEMVRQKCLALLHKSQVISLFSAIWVCLDISLDSFLRQTSAQKFEFNTTLTLGQTSRITDLTLARDNFSGQTKFNMAQTQSYTENISKGFQKRKPLPGGEMA